LNSISPSCKTAISILAPSEYDGVSIVIATGLEKIRCLPGIPNSNDSEIY
jgi:hypothetical protein